MESYFSRETILEDLIQEEKFESSWLNRTLGIQTSKIYSTAELSKRYFKTVKTGKEETVFKASKLLIILYVAFVLAMIGAFIIVIINSLPSDGSYILTGLIPGIIIFIVIITLFDIKNENQNFKIVISHEGITIRDIYYNWDEILDTFIIIRSEGKMPSYFLIVALNVGTTDRWEITNLLSFSSHKKLSAYIEYYKKIDTWRKAPPHPSLI